MQDNDKILENAEEILSAIKYMESIDTDAAYRRDLRALREKRREGRTKFWLRFAACLSLPLAAATGILAWMLFNPVESEQFASVVAPFGAVVKYELPDHSTVWLNSGSSLSYPVRFSRKSRTVQLEGEAYFDVQKNPDRPFTVVADGGMKVKVLGTKFNVSAYKDDSSIETTLESGKVEVITDSGVSLELIPGEQANYSKESGHLEKHKVNAYDHTAWKDGKMVFRNASLEEIFNRLEHKFGINIILSGQPSGDERYRATFRNESLDRTMDYLGRIAGFRWQFEDENTIAVQFR